MTGIAYLILCGKALERVGYSPNGFYRYILKLWTDNILLFELHSRLCRKVHSSGYILWKSTCGCCLQSTSSSLRHLTSDPRAKHSLQSYCVWPTGLPTGQEICWWGSGGYNMSPPPPPAKFPNPTHPFRARFMPSSPPPHPEVGKCPHFPHRAELGLGHTLFSMQGQVMPPFPQVGLGSGHAAPHPAMHGQMVPTVPAPGTESGPPSGPWLDQTLPIWTSRKKG